MEAKTDRNQIQLRIEVKAGETIDTSRISESLHPTQEVQALACCYSTSRLCC